MFVVSAVFVEAAGVVLVVSDVAVVVLVVVVSVVAVGWAGVVVVFIGGVTTGCAGVVTRGAAVTRCIVSHEATASTPSCHDGYMRSAEPVFPTLPGLFVRAPTPCVPKEESFCMIATSN